MDVLLEPSVDVDSEPICLPAPTCTPYHVVRSSFAKRAPRKRRLPSLPSSPPASIRANWHVQRPSYPSTCALRLLRTANPDTSVKPGSAVDRRVSFWIRTRTHLQWIGRTFRIETDVPVHGWDTRHERQPWKTRMERT